MGQLPFTSRKGKSLSRFLYPGIRSMSVYIGFVYVRMFVHTFVRLSVQYSVRRHILTKFYVLCCSNHYSFGNYKSDSFHTCICYMIFI